MSDNHVPPLPPAISRALSPLRIQLRSKWQSPNINARTQPCQHCRNEGIVSNTLIPATSTPATPIERISLIGTVKSARNPMATVEAEIRSVRPACRAARTEAEGPSFPAAIASRKRLTMSSA